MDQLPQSEQIEDSHGGKGQIRERPFSNCDESDICSLESSKVKNYARPSIGFLLVWLWHQYLTDSGCTLDGDSPFYWAKLFVYRMVGMIGLYHIFLALKCYFTYDSITIISWVATGIFILMLCGLYFLSDSIDILEISMIAVLFPSVALCMTSFIGMLAMYSSTLYTSWICGCKFSKLCQCRGVEKSSEIAFRCNKMEMKAIDPIPPFITICILSFTCVLRVAFMCLIPPEDSDSISAITEISFMVTLCMFAWVCYVNVVLLNNALFKEQDLGIGLVSGFIIIFMLMFLISILFGEAISTIVPWISAMMTSGLYGYTFEVFCSYKFLMEQNFEK